MTLYSSAQMVAVSIDEGVFSNWASEAQLPPGFAKYRNRVWDTQETGSDKSHYWVSDVEPDVNGLFYDGPGTWGVHTSGFSAIRLKVQGDTDPEYTVESNLWTPPETPHAQNDEFDQNVLGSEWYNYSWPLADFGTISYDTVDTYDTTFNTGNALRVNVNSDERRSWILAQPPAGRLMQLGKPYTLPTNVLIVSRMKFNQYYQSAVDSDRHVFLIVTADNAGKPDNDDSINLALNLQGTGNVKAMYFKKVGGVDSSYTQSTDVDAQGQALEYVAIHKIGTTYHGWVGTAAGNWIWMGSHTGFTATMQHVTFLFYTLSLDKPAAGVLGVDFVRFYETSNFLL